MKQVLIIGGGARESALALKFKQSPQVDHVYVAPGNPAMSLLGVDPINIDDNDFTKLIDFAETHQIDLTFVGPEVPLAAGIVDAFQAADQPIFGVTKKVAQLEASKTFAKDFMARHQLPTAASKTVHNAIDAHAEAATMGLPLVLKKDGLAAGKGVVIAQDAETLDETIIQTQPCYLSNILRVKRPLAWPCLMVKSVSFYRFLRITSGVLPMIAVLIQAGWGRLVRYRNLTMIK